MADAVVGISVYIPTSRHRVLFRLDSVSAVGVSFRTACLAVFQPAFTQAGIVRVAASIGRAGWPGCLRLLISRPSPFVWYFVVSFGAASHRFDCVARFVNNWTASLVHIVVGRHLTGVERSQSVLCLYVV